MSESQLTQQDIQGKQAIKHRAQHLSTVKVKAEELIYHPSVLEGGGRTLEMSKLHGEEGLSQAPQFQTEQFKEIYSSQPQT